MSEEKKKKKKGRPFWTIVGIVVVLIIGFRACGGSSPSYSDEINFVRGKTYFLSDSDVTIGRAINNYMPDNTWTHTAVENGPDIVILKGTANFKGEEAVLEFDFTVDLENNDFNYGQLKVDGVDAYPMEDLVFWGQVYAPYED